MYICLNDTEINKSGYTLDELLVGISIKSGGNIEKAIEDLINNNRIKRDNNGKLTISYTMSDTVDAVIIASDKEKEPESRILGLVKKLRDLFPEGKKEGTIFYWRGNTKEISRKLETFFKKFGKYSDDEIIEATKKYVASFNGDYSYMQLLKYFIWKARKNAAGETEEISELLSYIENKGQTEQSKDWMDIIY